MANFTVEDYNTLKQKISAIEDKWQLFDIVEIQGKKYGTNKKPLIRVADLDTTETIDYAKQIYPFLIMDGYCVGRAISFEPKDVIINELQVGDMDIRDKKDPKKIIGYEIFITVPNTFST